MTNNFFRFNQINWTKIKKKLAIHTNVLTKKTTAHSISHPDIVLIKQSKPFLWANNNSKIISGAKFSNDKTFCLFAFFHKLSVFHAWICKIYQFKNEPFFVKKEQIF